jgi:Phage capsid family
MKTLRRTIHPQVRILDEKNGLVEYVASSETLDSYSEIIRADGWRFDDFSKNSPFVDSHNYSSIECLLGKVVDFKVSGRRLIETVQWAKNVPENILAVKGFAMTAAGFLKAVSVGFVPVESVTPYDRDKNGWRENCEAVGIDPNGDTCRCIYVQQQQKELSACVLGANPDAVANVEKALQAGVLSDTDISKFARMNPGFGRAFEKRGHSSRTYSFSTAHPDEEQAISKMLKAVGVKPGETQPKAAPEFAAKEDLFKDFNRINLFTRGTFEGIEAARRNGNEREITQAVALASRSLGMEFRGAFGNPIENYLSAAPERRFFWNGIMRLFGYNCPTNLLKFRKSEHELRAIQNCVTGIRTEDYITAQKAVSGIVAGGGATLGYGLLLAVPVADELYDLLLHYGAYKYLGLRRMVGNYTSYAEVTGYPNAIFITPENVGTVTIPDDNQYSGVQLVPEANTIATIIKCSAAWLNDEKVDFSNVIVSKIIMGLAARIDFGAFQGTGADDQINGMMTGVFMNQKVKVYTTAAGINTISGLQRSDFINTIALVNPATLQRMEEQPPRWYIHPSFIPQLLQLKDGVGPQYLLKTPAETHGEWVLCGFPVTWAAQAPVIGTANACGVIAFGNPDAYLVSLQENFEIARAEKGAEFAEANFRFRAIGRGNGVMRDATGFALLALNAG